MTIEITLLGRFEVRRDGQPVPADAWGRRHAAALVKLLALSPGRRLHREQVIDALWPDDTVEDAAPKLHKAAHFARKAAGDRRGRAARRHRRRCSPTSPSPSTPRCSRPPPRRRCARGDDALLARRAGALHRRPPARRPLRGLGRRAAPAHPSAARRPAAPPRPLGRAGRARPHRRGGPPRAHARPRRAGRPARRAAPVRAARPRPRPASSAWPGQARRSRCATSCSTSPVARRRARRRPTTALVGRDERAGPHRTRLVERSWRRRPGRGRHPAALRPGRRRASRRCWPGPGPRPRRCGWRTGLGVAAADRRARGPTPRSSRPSPICAAATRRCSTASTTTTASRSTAPSPARDLDWSGEGGHQRLFVAVAELLRLAAADRGAMLLLDDLHEADEASLRLLHYLARCAVTERHRVGDRPPAGTAARRRSSRSGPASRRGRGASTHELAPARRRPTPPTLVRRHPARRTGRHRGPHRRAGRGPAVRAWSSWPAAPAPRRRGSSPPTRSRSPASIPATRDILQRVAVLGTTFDTDEFVALADLPDDDAFTHLDAALGAGRHRAHRHPLPVPPRPRARRPDPRRRPPPPAPHPPRRGRAASRPSARHRPGSVTTSSRPATRPPPARTSSAPPSGGGHRRLPRRLRAHRDASRPTSTGRVRAARCALRADLLFALGDPSAPPPTASPRARRRATTGGSLRARLARAAVIARRPRHRGGRARGRGARRRRGRRRHPAGARPGRLLHRRHRRGLGTSPRRPAAGSSAATRAGRCSTSSRSRVCSPTAAASGSTACAPSCSAPARAPSSHWPSSTATCARPSTSSTGRPRTPRSSSWPGSLRETAHRAGALRAVAFAAALIGEAALLAGDLDTGRTRARRSRRPPPRHRRGLRRSPLAATPRRGPPGQGRPRRGDAAAPTGAAPRPLVGHLAAPAATHLRDDDPAPRPTATRPAPWSTGRSRPSAPRTSALFCDIMLAVPAAIACADVGDLEHARHHLAVAEVAPSASGTAPPGRPPSSRPAPTSPTPRRHRRGADACAPRPRTSSTGPASPSTPPAAAPPLPPDPQWPNPALRGHLLPSIRSTT